MNFAARRAALAASLQDSALVLTANPESTRSHDTHYAYRPSSDILYLCGFDEPDTVLVLAPGHALGDFFLFVRPRDKEMEIWNGFRHGPEGAKSHFGADEAWSLSELDTRMPELLSGRRSVHYAIGDDPAFDRRMIGWIRGLRATRKRPDRAPHAIEDPRRVLHRARMQKSAVELESMHKAARISAAGHVEAMKATRPGMFEYQVQSIVEHTFRLAGASGPSYGSIVAGGANACILHYVSNDRELRDGDLLLLDAGAEYGWYAGDITRTFPVGRAFTGPQRDLYQAVLDAEVHAISLVRLGTTNYDVHQATIRRLAQSMIDLGLLRGSVDEAIGTEAYRRYFMHGTGHYLGLDVHDPGIYLLDEGVGFPYEAGMVVTIEPGLYVAADDAEAPEAFRGIGVRIEDDVVVTDDEPWVLTSDVPKSVDDIEALRRHAWSD
jgi:Xaa-Pro aminopeptidase